MTWTAEIRAARGKAELVEMSDEQVFDGCGPAMRALNERERQFVLNLMINGYNAADAAGKAGYNGNRDVLAITGHRLRKKPDVIRAMQEEALTRLNGDALMATGVLSKIASDPVIYAEKPAVCMKAALAILERIPAFVAEHKQTITIERRNQTKQEQIDDIVRLCKVAGVSPQKMLGSMGITIDAEFAEVAAPLPPIPGLEDCT